MKIVLALLCLLNLASAQEIRRFSFALIGDAPYAPSAGGRQVYPAPPYERMIASINADRRVDLTVHIGDIKAGDTRCDDEVYTKNLEYFSTYRRALIFTPGDNEWTDCHRENNGIFNPIERLQFLRSTFYTTDESFGRRSIKLKQQANYPENAIWSHGPVLFVTLHQPGSNNNRGRLTGEYPDATDAEYTARNTANMAWLDTAFQMAADDKANKGVVILSQANPFDRFLETVTPPYAVSGYTDFIIKLRDKVRTSGKQVVYVGGDTHYFRVDKPLTTTYPAANQLTPAGTRLMNFTRVEVYGQNDVHWVRVDVDLDNADLFEFKSVTVPGN